MQNIILQLIALQSYQELQLVFFVKDSYLDWDYAKILSHIWDTQRKIRFFAEEYVDRQEISTYLNNIFLRRM